MKHAKGSKSALVLAKINEHQTRPVTLLSAMSPAEQDEVYRQLLRWLSTASLRTTRYLQRRAHIQISNELDEEMAEDVWWFRFLQDNMLYLQETLNHVSNNNDA